MDSLPDCNECGNTRRIEVDGETRRCKCVVRHRIKNYLRPIGNFSEPYSKVSNYLDKKVSNFKQDIYININHKNSKTLNFKAFNGIVAKMLLSVYPMTYKLVDIYALRQKIINGDTEIYDFDQPLVVMVGGLPEEYEGAYMEDTKIRWTEEAYGKAGRQLVGFRLRKGLTTWYISCNNPYGDFEAFLTNNDFLHIDKDEYDKPISSLKGDVEGSF